MHLTKKKSLCRNVLYFLQRLLARPFMIAKSKQLGLQFKFKAEDVVGRNIYKYDAYDPETTQALLTEVIFNNGDIMLDIGANIGWYSAVFAKQGAKVHAFEPDPLNFELLEHNIQINQLKASIEPHLLAISDKKSIVPLYLYPNKNRGRHSLNAMTGSKKIDVEAVCLNDYLNELKIDIKKIKFLKIDIEGHEYPALKGADSLLQHTPYLLVEHAPEHITRGGYKPKDIINLLDEHNYIPFRINMNGIEETSIEALINDDKEQNIFWRKATLQGAQ